MLRLAAAIRVITAFAVEDCGTIGLFDGGQKDCLHAFGSIGMGRVPWALLINATKLGQAVEKITRPAHREARHGIRPLPGFVDRDAERARDLLVAQAPEMTQFHNLGDRRVFRRQAESAPHQREQAFIGRRGGYVGKLGNDLSAVFVPRLSPSVLDQYSPHRLGGGGEEMPPMSQRCPFTWPTSPT